MPANSKKKVPQVTRGDMSPHDIKLSKSNPRKRPIKQEMDLMNSMREFGVASTVVLDEKGYVLAGEGRVQAARKLGLTSIPIMTIANLTKPQKKAFRIADNKIAEQSEWDFGLLRDEFESIISLDIGMDLTMTGFDAPEIDKLLRIDIQESVGEPEPPPIDIVAEPVTKRGDIWLLGKHRILCGDSTDAESFKRLLGKSKAQMGLTDPPYNVPINGHVGGLGAIKHDEFTMASGEMNREEFMSFLGTIYKHMANFSINGSIHYSFMDWRHITDAITAGEEVFTELKNICVWNKDNGGMGTFYRSKHELVMVFKNGTKAHINNFGLGDSGRYRSNVWDYPGMNSLHPDAKALLKLHPTVKPTQMFADAMLDCSKPNGIILDPFAGSGTTILAAEQTNRRAYVIEYEPKYVDVAIQRWEYLTGKKAILEQ